MAMPARKILFERDAITFLHAETPPGVGPQLYHMPDHPGLLQTFIWQDLDVAPRFPALRRFLDFWSRSLDGKLHSVRVASTGLIKPAEFRFSSALLTLH